MLQDGGLQVSQTHHQVCVKARDNAFISSATEAKNLGMVKVYIDTKVIKGFSGCKTVPGGEGITDALVRELKVKPEGVPVEVVQSELKCLRKADKSSLVNLKKLELPTNIVADSERAFITVTGDMMAPSLNNLDRLLKLPTGCGEQNMIGLVPNIHLLNYLNATNQKNPAMERKARENMNVGYRRQAQYHHDDGSYSIWGKQGDEGSSWLTAFVVRSFSQASRFIEVDSAVVKRSVNWLMGTQMEDGCFKKKGYAHTRGMKGGFKDGSLTPFIGRQDWITT